MNKLAEILQVVWDMLNASYISDVGDMFTQLEIEYAEGYAIVLKHWDDGNLEAFDSKNELISKYEYLLIEECFDCGDKPERPVTVTSEPEDTWCLHCALSSGVSFNTPEAIAGIDEIEEAMNRWDCDADEAYDRLENGEEIEDEN
jgi:hypothetical protein